MLTEHKTYFYNFIPVKYEVTDERRNEILTHFPSPTLPDGEQFFDINKEENGNTIQARLLINDFNVHLTKANKQFMRLSFSNNLDVISGVLWDNQGEVDKYKPLLEKHAVFDVHGRVGEFNGRKSLTVTKLIPYESDINPFSFLPYTKQDISELTVELFSYLDQLQSPFKETAFAAMEQFWLQFRVRPAAKGFHHNYLGGLLKHTVGLMRFATYILQTEDNHYQAVIKLINVVEKAHKKELWTKFTTDDNTEQIIWNDTINHLYTMLQKMMEFPDDTPSYDLVLTSILFHDIGKLLEYDHAGKTYEEFSFLFPTATDTSLSNRKQAGITMDELGVMIGHIPYGVLILTKLIEAKQIEISLEDIHALSHCILCHHGLPEWGSCVRNPQTIEGYIIHLVDFLDSRYENTEKVK